MPDHDTPTDPVSQGLTALGYTLLDYDDARPDGAAGDELAQQARAVEAEMTRRYERYVRISGTAVDAYRELTDAGADPTQAKEQALARARDTAGPLGPDHDVLGPAVSSMDVHCAGYGEEKRLLYLIAAGQTTSRWLADTELTTAADAIDAYQLARDGAAAGDAAAAVAQRAPSARAEGYAAEWVAGWYREAREDHYAAVIDLEARDESWRHGLTAEETQWLDTFTDPDPDPDGQPVGAQVVDVASCAAAVDQAHQAVDHAERAQRADRARADTAARAADQARGAATPELAADAGLERA